MKVKFVMDLCSEVTLRNTVANLSHCKLKSSVDINNFNFGSLQTSVLKTCIPSLQKFSDENATISNVYPNSEKSTKNSEELSSKLSPLDGAFQSESQGLSSNPSGMASEQTGDKHIITQQATFLSQKKDPDHNKQLEIDSSSHNSLGNKQDLLLSHLQTTNKIDSLQTTNSFIINEDKSTHHHSSSFIRELHSNTLPDKTFMADIKAGKSIDNNSSSKEYHQNQSSPITKNDFRKEETVSEKKETQKLFTPEDLFKEHMQPNPYKTKSKIYQNLNAKEAGFVLQRPNRKPREDPLPLISKVTNIKLSDSSKTGGLIQPLATEDEKALQEGNKKLADNCIPEDIEDSSQMSPLIRPYEAVNFSLEQTIDNFDRDEYVKFRQDSNTDLEMPNASEAWLLQLLISRPKNKRSIKKIEKAQCNSSSCNRRGYRGNPDAFFYNPKTVPKYFSETRYAIKHRPRTNFSRKGGALCRGSQGSLSVELQRSGDCESTEPAKTNSTDKKSAAKPLVNGSPAITKPLVASTSFESASTTNIFDLTKSRYSKDAFTPFYRSFDESFVSYEETDSLAVNENPKSQKGKSETKSSSSEKQRHKRSKKVSKNVKYHKMINPGEKPPCAKSNAKDGLNRCATSPPTSLRLTKRPNFNVLSSTCTKEPNPLTTYGEKEPPKTTRDILEEVQSNLRARLASLEELNVLSDSTEERVGVAEGKSLYSYKLLQDSTTSIMDSSFTPPSSSSPSLRDELSRTGATRKKKAKKKTRKKGLRRASKKPSKLMDGEDDSDTEVLCRRPSPPWPSSSPKSLSGDSRFSFPSSGSSPRGSSSSSSSASSSTSSSSSSESTSSSSAEEDSSDAEVSLL